MILLTDAELDVLEAEIEQAGEDCAAIYKAEGKSPAYHEAAKRLSRGLTKLEDNTNAIIYGYGVAA